MGDAATDAYELWKKYEDIAMHFNELTLKFRLQALAGLAAIVAFIATGKIGDSPNVLSTGAWLLSAAWSGLAILDLGYYYRLLQGAADALRELEEKKVVVVSGSYLDFTKKLDTRIGRFGAAAPFLFYFLVLAILVGVAISSRRTSHGSPATYGAVTSCPQPPGSSDTSGSSVPRSTIPAPAFEPQSDPPNNEGEECTSAR